MAKNSGGTIEVNEQFRRALEAIEAGRNVFITGRAGTGKSTLLQLFRARTKKKIVVLAPTGVAALNVGGQTIHSFFRFKTDITPEKVKRQKPDSPAGRLIRSLDAVVVDEISMVRADLLDCVDKALRLNGRHKDRPFGGVQLIFFGDLYQLPPVVMAAERHIFKLHYESPYFFSAWSLAGLDLEFVELEKVYRQSDPAFIAVLNAIRNNTARPEDLELINTRLDPGFVPPKQGFYITLTATNDLAARLNAKELAGLPGRTAKARAKVRGEFERRSFPADEELFFKPGAQVMMLNNDREGRWVNGTVGRVKAIEQEGGTAVVMVQANGDTFAVLPHTWDMNRYYWDEEAGAIATQAVGSFTQYPLRLAWAITIHKSQGKTFERVIIDLERGTFASGQLYVALSRATSLQGIVLRKPVQPGHIRVDWDIVRWVTGHRQRCDWQERQDGQDRH